MRIIGGDLRRRRLLTPKDDRGPRPIPDRVRQSMFNLLRGHLEGATALDLFAGVGSFGLEAISRGAERVIFVERDPRTAKLLEQNIELLGVRDRAEVIVTDALGPGPVMRCPQDVTLVMMDPPYAMARDVGEWARIVTQAGRLIPKLADDGFLLLRTPWPHLVAPAPEESPRGREGRGRKARERRGRGDRDGTGDRGRGGRGGRGDRGDRGGGRPPRREVIAIELDEEGLEGKDLDAIFDELEARDAAVPPAAPVAPPQRADLKIPGADGPETHDYGTMAVHLYARTRKAPAADPAAEASTTDGTDEGMDGG